MTVPGPSNWLADGIVSHNSGSLEQDSDLVLFLYRDKPAPDVPKSPILETEIIVGKNRNGPTGLVRLEFQEFCMRFVPLATHRDFP